MGREGRGQEGRSRRQCSGVGTSRGVRTLSHPLRPSTTTRQRGARGCSDATGRAPGEVQSGWGTWFAQTGTRGEPARGRSRTRSSSRALPSWEGVKRSRETKPISRSHCHLHTHFPAKQLLSNCCPQMSIYEADNCMQNTASIAAQYGRYFPIGRCRSRKMPETDGKRLDTSFTFHILRLYTGTRTCRGSAPDAPAGKRRATWTSSTPRNHSHQISTDRVTTYEVTDLLFGAANILLAPHGFGGWEAGGGGGGWGKTPPRRRGAPGGKRRTKAFLHSFT